MFTNSMTEKETLGRVRRRRNPSISLSKWSQEFPVKKSRFAETGIASILKGAETGGLGVRHGRLVRRDRPGGVLLPGRLMNCRQILAP